MARRAKVGRQTRETSIQVELDLDGTGQSQITTGVGMLDHLIDQLARHGMFDIMVEATGDLAVDAHHTVEDVGLALGRAFAEALGERRGIRRMGDALVPMDEALAQVAVDFSGRPHATIEAAFSTDMMGELPTEMVAHFLHSLAIEARMTLHGRVLSGSNDHHKAEALFKALGRALDMASSIDGRLGETVPSTKGSI